MAKVVTWTLKKISGGKQDIVDTICNDYRVNSSRVDMVVRFNYSGEAEIDFFVKGYDHSVCFMTGTGQMKFIPRESYYRYYGKVEEVIETESDEQKAIKNLTEEVKKLKEELKKEYDKPNTKK